MPIPDFDLNLVLPPHLGDPRNPNQLSPYPCTLLEVCQKFATSRERVEILTGLLDFRARSHPLNVIQGFQWFDGSFMENIELHETRPPEDMDVVTFFVPPTPTFIQDVLVAFPEFGNRRLSQQNFKVDHFPVNLMGHPYLLVELTRYWTGLFSHRRDGVWKGMLRIELNTPVEDASARVHLRGWCSHEAERFFTGAKG